MVASNTQIQCTIRVGFEVLTAVVIKSTVFWDITPCGQLKVNRNFGRTYGLHLQSRISGVRYQRENRCCYILEDSTV
jgi:hypothetical protein